MKNVFQFISYLFFRLLVLIFSILPFGAVYAIGSFLAWILEKLLTYRRDVIMTNLKIAFPNHSDLEIEQNMKAYYRYMADLAVESIKGSTMSIKQLNKRFLATNPELIEVYFKKDRNVMIVTSHIGNFEWAAIMIGNLIPHICLAVYKPLSNKYLDAYIRRTRGRLETKLVSMTEVRDYLSQAYEKPYAFILVSDQSPKNMSRAIWCDIFNLRTPFAHGLDDISKEKGLPIIYVDIQKVRRGYYELTFKELVTSPKKLSRGESTKIYASHVESIVSERPVEWLWSHKRWKRLDPPVY